MVHPLQISELCREVCEYVKATRGSSWRGTLAALSRCSHVFFEEAVRVLWAEMYDFEPLLNLIPAVVVSKETRRYSGTVFKVFRITRPLDKEDWARFNFYGRYIENSGPLRPSLRVIDWSDDSLHEYHPIRSFVSRFLPFAIQSLQSITLSVPSPRADSISDQDELTAFLHMLPHRCPNVDALSITEIDSSTSLLFIGAFKHLQELSFDEEWDEIHIDAPALRAISTLPQLRRLRGFRAFSRHLLNDLFEPGFPSLNQLEVTHGDIRGVEIVLSIISSHSFRYLVVEEPNVGTWRDYVDCLATISRKGQHLWEVSLPVGFDQPDPMELRDVADSVASALSSLSLPEATTLAASGKREGGAPVSSITTDQARKMAKAWPRLRKLDMYQTLPAFSLESLAAFALGCKNLVEFRATHCFVGTPLSPGSFPVLSHGLRLLGIESTQGEFDDLTVAGVIDGLFPNLALDQNIDDDRLINPGVEACLAALQKARKDHEMRMLTKVF
ncbi:hypothetical protein JAAARDRAFT_74574 [Jaapia argillacea MUCL 33604]|uniref:F-box domain-containing protein n=1 Tax=Jaapia argillacea MUCL 33604 TaxID=933084 RepID=A0A067P4F8_9AGAM|nr:hypothetical protein JAAARDRAFT_74574 [Jaapia argillacea MUCL 33604]